MKTTIKENNELIAEFMGARHTVFSSGEKGMTFWSETDDEPRMGCFPGGSTNIFLEQPAKYHESWDWLMPVVEKVREVGAEISISYKQGSHPTVCYVYCQLNKSMFSNSWGVYKNAYGNRTETMIEAVYNSVIEFINWYNENK